MQILDKVYNTFINLDRDYARSKKSRTDFLKDKFGGDINIGSIIILDAVTSDMDESNPSDIEKLTYLKKSFARFQSLEDHLDALSSFEDASDSSEFQDLMMLLQSSMAKGTHQEVVSQFELNRTQSGCVHFFTSKSGSKFAPFAMCSVLHAYNEYMIARISGSVNRMPETNMDDYLQLRDNGVTVKVAPSRVPSLVKANA